MSELVAFIRHAAEQHPDLADPKALVPFVMAEVQDRERDFLESLLPKAIAEVLRRRQPARTEAGAWENFLDERMPTENGYRFVRDCDADALEAGALRRRRFAGNLDARARQYAETAVAVRTAGVATAGALPSERGEILIRELRIRLQLTRRQRLTTQARTRGIVVAERRRDELKEMLERGESPVVAFLRQHRDDLLRAIAATIDHIENGEKTDEVLQ